MNFEFKENQKVSLKKKCTGVIFLFQDDEVVFIGQSDNVFSRIEEYKTTKEFTAWNYIKAPKEDLADLVAKYIIQFKPRLNNIVPPNSVWVSKNSLKVKYGLSKTSFNKALKDGLFSEVEYFKTGIYVKFEDVRKWQGA